MIGSDGISWLWESVRRILSNGIYGIILLLLSHARSALGYDAVEACRHRRLNETSGLYRTGYLYCGPPLIRPHHFYCCGRETSKYCCAWTTYIINTFGAGSTGLGVGLLVGLGFLTAFVIFLLICLIFRGCVVARWTASERSNAKPRKRHDENVAM